METLKDLNILHQGYLRSMDGSSWKAGPQLFELDFLNRLVKIVEKQEQGEYEFSAGSEFDINERGHMRHIHGGVIDDRVLEHAMCDNVLHKALEPYISYNNSASQKGKGVEFARKSFERDLHNYYLRHGDNKGYVGFVDFSKFYDNIRHDVAYNLIAPHIDDYSAEILKQILKHFRVDVSYMSDEQYKGCMAEKFNSIEYYKNVTKDMQTGEKFIEKSLNIGNQTSQSIGIFVPTPIDNYITCVRGFRDFGRYMDDIVLIHESREYIQETINGIREQAAKLGIFVNEKKTHICKMSDTFTYLQRRYYLDENGRVVKRIKQKNLTRERRRIKAYKRKVDSGAIPYEDVEQAVKSWMGEYSKVMSKRQIKNIKKLYMELFGKELVWKQK